MKGIIHDHAHAYGPIMDRVAFGGPSFQNHWKSNICLATERIGGRVRDLAPLQKPPRLDTLQIQQTLAPFATMGVKRAVVRPSWLEAVSQPRCAPTNCAI